ncbi:MAG: ABC transporter substrate-binding protein [Bacteroidales bacterium]
MLNHRTLYFFIGTFLLSFWLFGCGTKNPNSSSTLLNPEVKTAYAKGFRIINEKNLRIIEIQSPWDSTQLLGKFIVWPDSVLLPDSLKDRQIIKTPVNNIIALSSTQWAMSLRLGKPESIKGVSEASFIQNKIIRKGLEDNKILEVSAGGAYKPELIIGLQADIILYSPDPAGVPDVLGRAGVNMFPWPDYFEIQPLGRTEWIKVMGILLQEEEKANYIFDSIESEYLRLKNLASGIKERPTIFADKEFSGQWYVPGGKSYIACLFKDAGADYIWSENTSTASFPLGIESILNQAHNADYWRIAQAATENYSYSELQNENEIYASFKAFRERNILFCNTSTTAYFEKSQLEPHFVLSDLISLMHPELLPDYQPVYYTLLK